MRRHVVVTGPMASGKSTLATRLAEELGVTHRDSDADIETLFGRTGREIAESDGVDVLHRIESAVLLGALADPTQQVISAAASVADDDHALDALARRAIVLLLDLPVDAIIERLGDDRHRRDVSADELATLVARRRPRLRTRGAHVIDAAGSPAEVAARAAAVLDHP